MGRSTLRLLTAIQLTRMTMALGAVGDVWFIILLTQAEERYQDIYLYSLSTPLALLAGMIVAVGLFAYGASLNDVMDVRHDATFQPHRPIPAGRIRVGQAIVITVSMLIVAMLAADTLGHGAFRMTVLIAVAVLFYNATGKYVPPVGIVTIGLIHAGHMFLANPLLAFTLPAFFVMTHAMVIDACVYRMEEKRPPLTSQAVLAIVLGWGVWSIVLIGLSIHREGLWPDGLGWHRLALPVCTAIAFVLVARWKSSIGGRQGAEKLRRYGALWQSLYGTSWLLALNHQVQALWLGAFALMGFLLTTLVKELTGWSGRPVSYRG